MERIKIKKKKRRRCQGKGQAFERLVCKQLSRWASKGKHEDLFWRSPMSGGRATQMRKRLRADEVAAHAGDVVSVRREGNFLTREFVIECKFYKSLDLGAALLLKRGRVYNFWRKLLVEADACMKSPMLIARQNNCPTLLILNMSGREKLEGMAASKNLNTLGLCIARFARRDMNIFWFENIFTSEGQ